MSSETQTYLFPNFEIIQKLVKLELPLADSIPVFLLCVICALTIQRTWKYLRFLFSLPPGPWGIPYFGYLYFMGKEKHTRFMQLANYYGAIFSARLGNQLTIVLSDYKLMREAFRREEFTGRPDSPFLRTLEGFGIINSSGTLWKDQRRFLHEKLRQFGMTYSGSGKQIMEKRIMTEVDELLQHCTATNGKPTDMNAMYACAVSNVICNIMMSVRFTLDDPKFKEFTFLIEEGMRLFGEIHTLDYLPPVQYLPGKRVAKDKITKNRQVMFDFYRNVIAEHRKTFDPNVNRDLIDTYLSEIMKAKEAGRDNELFEGKDHDTQIMQVVSDLFSAGMETIKTTLLWLNVFMLRNPDMMQKVKDELDQVVGRSRLPSFEDLPYLPVTESTILEAMRRSSIVPLATTHSPTRDVKLNGYTIPAGAHVVPLINTVHMDPTLWDKPEEFVPSRFLNDQGKVTKPEFFMPFGVGRRMCLGDVLARMELFLFYSSLMHTFDISLPDNAELPSLKGNVGVTITPQTFEVILTPRPLLVGEQTISTPIRNIGSA